MEELVASTPSSSRPVEASSPAEIQEISATTSDVRLDLSETPSEFDPPSPAAVTAKRPLSDDPGASPPDKRPRAASSPDDSDVQFVEEVEPDVQVVFSSQEPASSAAFATPSAAAESQTGFRLNLSPSQSEEVTPAVVTVVSPASHQSEEERDVEPDVEPDTASEAEPDAEPDGAPDAQLDVEPETAPDAIPESPSKSPGEVEVDPSRSPSSDDAADSTCGRAADPSVTPADVPSDRPTVPSTESPQHHDRPAGSLAEASQLAGEPADSLSSQGFQPTTMEPRSEATESAEGRLPHIQTPQVASSGDSASPLEGDTVFGQAQRLIEEQNRRREVRDRPAASESPPQPAQPRVEEREAVSPREEELLREVGAGRVEKPGSATVEEEPSVTGGAEKAESITLEDEPLVVPVEEDEPLVVPVEENEPPVVPVEENEPPVVPVEEDEPPVVPVEEDRPMMVTGPEKKPGSSPPDDEPLVVIGRTEKPPLVTIEGGESTPTAELADKDAISPSEGQSKAAILTDDKSAAPETRKEADKIADDSQASQSVGSFLSDWRSVMKSSSRTTEISVSPAEGATVQQAGTAAPRKENGVQAAERAPETEAEAAPEAEGAPEAEAMEAESSQELAEEPLPSGSAMEDPYRFHTTQSQETQPYRLRPAKHIKVS